MMHHLNHLKSADVNHKKHISHRLGQVVKLDLKLNLGLELKSHTRFPGAFSGYASLFDEIDSQNDRIVRGAFKRSLHALATKKSNPKMLWQHQEEQVIGSWLEVKEDQKGLFVSGQLALEVQKAKEAYELLRTKAIDGLSIGFIVRKSIKGTKPGAVRLITDLDLLEVSLVTFPANHQARISSVS